MSTNGKPNIYITRAIPTKALELLKSECNVEQWEEPEIPVPRDHILKYVTGVDGLYCLLTDKIDKTVIDAAGPQLKVVSTMSVGFDHIDLDECRARNIAVGNTPRVSTEAVAELAVALLLATTRRLFEAAAEVKNGGWGTWSPLWLCGSGLKDSTVGVFGFGRIGVQIARNLQPFGVKKFLYSDVVESPAAESLSAEFVDIDTLLRKSDFVILSCALTKETAGMFNKETFAKMKSNAVLVNTSRGGVINQKDLYEALTTGQIRAAGLDVTDPEPMATDDPLLTLNNCVVLPHVGSSTVEAREDMAILAAKNLLAGIKGEKLEAPVVMS